MAASRIAAAWRRGGPALVARVAVDRVADRLAEARLRIAATGLVPIETVVDDWQDCHDYFPTSFDAFRRLMAFVPIRPGHDTFIDIGSGKGRVLLLAATYPFARVIGVEIAPSLNEAARQNIARCSRKLACTNIELWQGNAAAYAVPPDATVLYFYNPFHGPVLGAVFDGIRRSLDLAPRTLWIMFNNTAHFRNVEPCYSWLTAVARLSLEHDCAVYRATG